MARILKVFDDPVLVLLAVMILALAGLSIFARWIFGPDDSVAMALIAIATLFAGGLNLAIRPEPNSGNVTSEPEKPANG